MIFNKKEIQELQRQVKMLSDWKHQQETKVCESVVHESDFRHEMEEISLRILALIEYLNLEMKETFIDSPWAEPIRKPQIRRYKAIKKETKK